MRRISAANRRSPLHELRSRAMRIARRSRLPVPERSRLRRVCLAASAVVTANVMRFLYALLRLRTARSAASDELLVAEDRAHATANDPSQRSLVVCSGCTHSDGSDSKEATLEEALERAATRAPWFAIDMAAPALVASAPPPAADSPAWFSSEAFEQRWSDPAAAGSADVVCSGCSLDTGGSRTEPSGTAHLEAGAAGTAGRAADQPLPPIAESAIDSWRRAAGRESQPDGEWAARIAAVLLERAAGGSSTRFSAWFAPLLANRTRLDRQLAARACTRVCTQATACAEGMCVCSDADSAEQGCEPSAALAAAHVVLGDGVGDDVALRNARRYDSVYAKARAELSALAATHATAFEANVGEDCTAIEAAGFAAAYELTLQPLPAAPLQYAELLLQPTAEYAKCAKRRTAGDTFVVSVASTDVMLQSPVLRELGGGRYQGPVLAADPGNYSLSIRWINSRYAGWFDLPAAARRQLMVYPVDGRPSPLCPSSRGLSKAPPAPRLEFAVPLESSSDGSGGQNRGGGAQPRACGGGAFSGRWIGDEWAPLGCYLRQYDLRLLDRCAAARPLRLHLYGDSVMRGLFFDLADLITGQTQDRVWAKRHAGPGKGKRLAYSRGGIELTWAWWTLNTSAPVSPISAHPNGSGPAPRMRVPPQPEVDEWAIDEDAVLLFGSAAHNMRYGSVDEYASELRALADRLRARMPQARARLLWLVSAAHHILDDPLPCNRSTLQHTMSYHRALLFSAMGADTMGAVVPLLDLWRITADQAKNCANVHYDSLYVKDRLHGDGLVSRTAANLLLNVACNVRLLPSAAVRLTI